MKKENRKKLYRYLFMFLGLATLGFMVYKVGIAQIYEGLLKTGWWFVAVIALWFVIYIFNSLSWSIIIRDGSEEGKRIPFWHVYRLTVSGFAINYITPVVALGGEPYRILELKKYVGVHKATSSVILFSMMHIYTHFIFWMFSIVLALLYLKLPLAWVLVLIGLLVLFILVNLYFLQGYKHGLLVKTFRILGKIPLIKKIVRNFNENEQKQESLRVIDGQIAHLHTQRRSSFYWSIGTEFITRILGCVEVYFIMLAIEGLYPGVHINMIDAIIITAGYSFFANMMFFMPLQLGAREGGFYYAFKYSVGLTTAANLLPPVMVVSIVTRIRELAWILIGLVLVRVEGKPIPKGKDIAEMEHSVEAELKRDVE